MRLDRWTRQRQLRPTRPTSPALRPLRAPFSPTLVRSLSHSCLPPLLPALLLALLTAGCGSDSTGPGQPKNSVSAPTLLATLRDRFQEAWVGSAAVADLDGDGTMEIIAARDNQVIGWHLDGTIRFRGQTQGRVWSSPVVVDLLPAVPGLEVVVASRGSIYAWDSGGALCPGFPYAWRDELRSLAAGDIDNDGQLELVAVTTTPLESGGQTDIIIAVNHDGSAVTGFPANTGGSSGCDAGCFVTGGYDQNVALGDVDGNHVADILATQDNAYLSLHDGTGRAFACAPIFTGRTKIQGVRALLDYTLAQQGFANDEQTDNQGEFTNSAPAIADIDGDGKGELVVLSSVQNAAQTDRLRGVALWVLRDDGTRPTDWVAPVRFPDYLAGLTDFAGTNIVAATNQVAVADIDPARAGPEFIVAGFDGKIHAVDSRARVLWSSTYTTDPNVLTAGVAIADLSGDGVPEIVFATYSPDPDKGQLVVLDSEGTRLHAIALPDRGSMAVPTIADIDKDGDLEIVVNLKDAVDQLRQVLVFTVTGSSTNQLLWPTGRGSLRRDGRAP
jgi:hypothetical protein